MKKLFASVLAVSLAITGIHVTSYAAEEATTVSVEAQKSNPYMSEIDKELKDFFAKYNAEKDCSRKEILLDTAINEVKGKIDSHAHFLNVMEDDVQKRAVENKSAALKLKHSILSTVKAKEQEKRSAPRANIGVFFGGLFFGIVVGTINTVCDLLFMSTLRF